MHPLFSPGERYGRVDRPMCWLDGLANPVRQVALAVLVLACVLTVGMATAQDHIPRGQPIPQSIRWVNATATGANARASASWTYGGTTSNHTFPVPVGSGSVGAAARAAIRRGLPVVGWGLVLRDIVNGAGWAIDELQHQVVVPGQEQPPLSGGVWCMDAQYWGLPASQRCAAAPANAPYPTAPDGSGYSFTTVTQQSPTVYNARYERSPSDFYVMPVSFYSQPPPGAVNANPGSDPVPVSDYDLGQLLKNHPEVFNAVLIDPDTGAPIRIPELVDALNDLRRSLEAANGVQTPGTDIAVPDDLANPTPSESPYPGFCDWATVVCEFITWFKLDPDDGEHPEVPYEEREVEMVPYNSGLGGGSCPSSTMVPVLDGEVEISWVGICGFVTYLRPLLIACAWILSAFIVVNARPGRL